MPPQIIDIPLANQNPNVAPPPLAIALALAPALTTLLQPRTYAQAAIKPP
jgi:hypothetical protein